MTAESVLMRPQDLRPLTPCNAIA